MQRPAGPHALPMHAPYNLWYDLYRNPRGEIVYMPPALDNWNILWHFTTEATLFWYPHDMPGLERHIGAVSPTPSSGLPQLNPEPPPQPRAYHILPAGPLVCAIVGRVLVSRWSRSPCCRRRRRVQQHKPASGPAEQCRRRRRYPPCRSKPKDRQVLTCLLPVHHLVLLIQPFQVDFTNKMNHTTPTILIPSRSDTPNPADGIGRPRRP